MGTLFVKQTNMGTRFSTPEPWAHMTREQVAMAEFQLLVGMTRPWVLDMGLKELSMAAVAVATTRVWVWAAVMYSKRSTRVVSLAFSTAPEAPALAL